MGSGWDHEARYASSRESRCVGRVGKLKLNGVWIARGCGAKHWREARACS